MGGMGLREARGDGVFEVCESRIIYGVQALFFDKLPQPFDKIQVGRISGKIQQFDVQKLG